jgi:carbon-monoxide dehydrogenase medium subunit
MSATRIGSVSVAIGGCGPVPVTDAEANALLSQSLEDEDAVLRAGEILARVADPVDDVRATADYRRLVLPRLLWRAARETAKQLEVTS